MFRVLCFVRTPLRRRRPSGAYIPVANRQAYLLPQRTATASTYERSHRVNFAWHWLTMHSTSSMSVRVGGGTHPTHVVTSTACYYCVPRNVMMVRAIHVGARLSAATASPDPPKAMSLLWYQVCLQLRLPVSNVMFPVPRVVP